MEGLSHKGGDLEAVDAPAANEVCPNWYALFEWLLENSYVHYNKLIKALIQTCHLDGIISNSYDIVANSLTGTLVWQDILV